MLTQGKMFDRHVRTIKRRLAEVNSNGFNKCLRNRLIILLYEINWVRRIINDGVEALTRRSQARFQINNLKV